MAPALAARSRIVVIGARDDLRRALRELPEEALPVAAGGDGTVNLLVAALRASALGDRTIGVLPLGTGNALAHPLGVGSLARALRALDWGDPRSIDLMTTTHPAAPVAMVSISAGFEARMLATVSATGAWRRWLRVLPGLVRLAGGVWAGTTVTLDGQSLVGREERIHNVGLYNLPCYGFGWRMWPDADPEDGLAEAVVCRSPRSYLRTLRHGLRTAQAGDTADRSWRRWSRAHIESSGPVQIDGEVIAAGAFDVVLEPRALRVLALTEALDPESSVHGSEDVPIDAPPSTFEQPSSPAKAPVQGGVAGDGSA
jgi:diacylglycerol kinase family enzyme